MVRLEVILLGVVLAVRRAVPGVGQIQTVELRGASVGRYTEHQRPRSPQTLSIQSTSGSVGIFINISSSREMLPGFLLARFSAATSSRASFNSAALNPTNSVEFRNIGSRRSLAQVCETKLDDDVATFRMGRRQQPEKILDTRHVPAFKQERATPVITALVLRVLT